LRDAVVRVGPSLAGRASLSEHPASAMSRTVVARIRSGARGVRERPAGERGQSHDG
jgi:hypothetical protein